MFVNILNVYAVSFSVIVYFIVHFINTQIALKSSICVLNEYLQNGFVFLDVKYNVLNSSLNIIIHLISDINKRLNQNKTVKLILKINNKKSNKKMRYICIICAVNKKIK